MVSEIKYTCKTDPDKHIFMVIRYYFEKCLQKLYLLFPFSSRLIDTTIGSGTVSFKPAAVHVYFPKSSSVLGVMDKIVFVVLHTVPLGNLQVTSGGGNPRTGQHMVVFTPREALWFVLGHEMLLL